MKFAIEKAAGLAALQRVAAIVNRKHTIPIMANVLIVADSLGVRFRASDLDIESTAFAEASVAEPGTITAKTDVLQEIFRNAADGSELVLSMADGDARMAVKSGRSRFQVATLPAADFPTFSDDQWDASLTFQAEALAALLGRVAYAMSADGLRYILNSTHVHAVEDGLRVVATDGHVLAYRDLRGLGDAAGMLQPICLPASTAVQFQRALAEVKGEVTLSISARKIRLDYGEDSILSKLLDGGYPDYARAVPKDFAGSFVVHREALASAVRRVLVMGADKSRSVKLEVDGQGILTLSAQSIEGEAADEVPTEAGAAPFVVGFNGSLLLETLASITSPTVECRWSDSTSPTVWAEPGDLDGLSVIMPLQI